MIPQPTFRRALYWAYGMSWGENGSRALFTFLLASILGPRDFGAVALAMIYITFVTMILDQGLFAALIQRKDLELEHLDAVFWLNIAVGLVLIGLSVFFSGWWARVYHLPELGAVISVLSATILIESLAKVQRSILQRELDFRSLAIRSNASVVVGGVVGVTMAFAGWGIWSLVWQKVVEDTAALFLLWTVARWRPRLRFSLPHLRELLWFSSATFLNKLGSFAYSQADALLMGIFFGPVAVGLFRLAQRLVSTTVDVATSALQVVSFSEFCRLQDRPAELRRRVLSCVRLGSLVTFPALAGLAVISGHLLSVVGDKWVPAADTLSILCLFGITETLSKFTGPLLSARSRPHLVAGLTWSINLVSIGSLVTSALLLKNASVQRQISGIAATRLVVGAGVMAPIFLFCLLRFAQIPMKQYIRAIWPSTLAALAASTAVVVLNRSGLLGSARPLSSLTGDLAVGGLAGIGTLLAADRQLLGSLRALLVARLCDLKRSWQTV